MLTLQVVDTSGVLQTAYTGSIEVAFQSGVQPPSTVSIAGGIATLDLAFELAGANYLIATSLALGSSLLPVDVLPRLPVKSSGTGTGGAVLDGGGVWDADGAWAPSVLVVGTAYRMWYASSNSSLGTNIGVAVSADGVEWTKIGSTPVVGPAVSAAACHSAGADYPNVVHTPTGDLMMLYRGSVTGTPPRTHLCRATSTDGIAWTQVAGGLANEAILERSGDKFDNVEMLGASTVLLEDGSYFAVYAANGSAEVTSIHDGPESIAGSGVAVSADGTSWSKVPGPLLHGALLLGFAESTSGDSWDAYAQIGPALTRDEKVFRLWSSGKSEGGKRIGYHVSMNPLDFGAHVDNYQSSFHDVLSAGGIGEFDELGVELPSVVEGLDGTRRIFYTGTDIIGRRRIGVARFE